MIFESPFHCGDFKQSIYQTFARAVRRFAPRPHMLFSSVLIVSTGFFCMRALSSSRASLVSCITDSCSRIWCRRGSLSGGAGTSNRHVASRCRAAFFQSVRLDSQSMGELKSPHFGGRPPLRWFRITSV